MSEAPDQASEHEVVVLGGGPAGCAAATLLARRSHRVALVRPPAPPAGALAESVPPSARKLLSELGLLEAIEAAPFAPNGGNTVWWAGSEARVETFGGDALGFHADRRGLEEALVAAAESVGVRVFVATARSAEEGPSGWNVRCDGTDGDRIDLTAPWVIDATGRHGLLARREGRASDRDTTTLALVRRWRRPGGWDPAWSTHTLVESYRDGWAWSVPLSGDVRCFTAMVDQREAELAGGSVSEMLDSELAKTEHLAAALEGAEPVSDGWACPASLYSATSHARPGLALAGDAGSFIDPLSSYGVKKALSSGWLAGIVAHTSLVDEPMTGTAVAFFDARERAVYRSYRRASADFFEDAGRVYGHRFWSARAEAARVAAGQADAGSRQELGASLAGSELVDPVPEADVRRAFDEIRGRERLRAARGPTLRVFEGPAVQGQRIVLAQRLASAAYPDGLTFVRGVDLRRLVEVAPGHAEVPDGWSAYNGVASPVTLPDYLTALSTAFAAGLLVHEDG